MLEVQNDRCSESSRMAHTWVWKLLHLIARSLLLTARLRHRLKHLQGEDAAVTVRTRFMFLVLFSRKIRQWTYCSLHTHTSPSNAKYVQKLHLPLLSAFGGRGTEELCVPGLLKPGITFPELWASRTEDEIQVKTRADRPGERLLQNGWGEATLVLLTRALFSSRSPSFAFLQEMPWAAPASVWSAVGQAQQLSAGHPLCVWTPHSPWGKARSWLLWGGENTYGHSTGELQTLWTHKLCIFFPLHGLFVIRTMQQHGKGKHWYRSLWFSSPIISLHVFPQGKGKENNFYDSTFYFSSVGVDIGDVFARRVCLSKDKQSCLS